MGVEQTGNENTLGGYAGLDSTGKLTGSQQVYGTAANTAAQGNDSRFQGFPVGSVYLAVVATDPATLLGYGTWSQIAKGTDLDIWKWTRTA